MSVGSASIQRLERLPGHVVGDVGQRGQRQLAEQLGAVLRRDGIEGFPAQPEGVERPVLHAEDLQQEQPRLRLPGRGRGCPPQRAFRLGRQPQSQAGPALAEMRRSRRPERRR